MKVLRIKLPAITCLVLVLMLLILTPATAVIVMNTDPANIGSQIVQSAAWRYTVSLDPNPAVPVAAPGAGGSAAEAARLAADFPGWNFIPGWPPCATAGGGDAPGNLTISRYDANIGTFNAATGNTAWNLPLKMTVNYLPGPSGPWGPPNPANPCPPTLVTQWVQFVTTNDPHPGAPANTPYIDPFDYDRAFSNCTPFYWTETERVTNTGLAGGIQLQFTDRPGRGLADAGLFAGGVSWHADLFLVTWNQTFTPPQAGCPPAVNPGPTNVWISVHGVHWGFTITRIAMAGVAGTLDTGGVGGDKDDVVLAAPSDGGNLVSSSGVGGVAVPVDMLSLLAPYLGLASVISGIFLTTIYVRRGKRRNQR